MKTCWNRTVYDVLIVFDRRRQRSEETIATIRTSECLTATWRPSTSPTTNPNHPTLVRLTEKWFSLARKVFASGFLAWKWGKILLGLEMLRQKVRPNSSSCLPDSGVRVGARFRRLAYNLPPQSIILKHSSPVLVLHLCYRGVKPRQARLSSPVCIVHLPPITTVGYSSLCRLFVNVWSIRNRFYVTNVPGSFMNNVRRYHFHERT